MSQMRPDERSVRHAVEWTHCVTSPQRGRRSRFSESAPGVCSAPKGVVRSRTRSRWDMGTSIRRRCTATRTRSALRFVQAQSIDRSCSSSLRSTTRTTAARRRAARPRRACAASERTISTCCSSTGPRAVPLSGTLETMAALRREGKVRNLGVSNFTTALLAEAVEVCGADLLCNQVEYHPFLPQRRVRAAITRYGMMLTAYSPLAKGLAARDRRSTPSARGTARQRAKSRCAG